MTPEEWAAEVERLRVVLKEAFVELGNHTTEHCWCDCDCDSYNDDDVIELRERIAVALGIPPPSSL